MKIQGWFPLGLTSWILTAQRTLKSLLQHHSSKASILRCSAFFIVQLTHPYMTTGKTTALTIQTFVGNVMSLLFNRLPRFVIAFLPRSKCLLISRLQSPSAVILEPKKIKSVTASPSICQEVMGLDAMIFVFWMLKFQASFGHHSMFLARSDSNSMFNFSRNWQNCLLKGLYHFTFPKEMYEGSNFSTFSSILVIICLFDYSQLGRCEAVSYWSDDLHFPDD